MLKGEMKVATTMPNLSNLSSSEEVERPGTGVAAEDIKSVPTAISSRSSSGNFNNNPNPKACAFFARGNCRNGNDCKFSHTMQAAPTGGGPNAGDRGGNRGNNMAISSSGAVGEMTSPPPPILINLPPGHPVYSIDVECVATGVQHNARSIAQVALVDEWSRPVFSVLIKQDMPVSSYITELTGLTKEILDAHGLPLAEALALLRAHLPPNAILVGQSILKDVQWLQLAEGVDYFSLIDLSALFRVWNQQRGQYTNFSQDHCARVWIGVGERAHHNAIEDAAISMSLFNAYRMVQWDPNRLYQMQMATLSSDRIPGFSAIHPVIDGCCMGNRKKCSCGSAFL